MNAPICLHNLEDHSLGTLIVDGEPRFVDTDTAEC